MMAVCHMYKKNFQFVTRSNEKPIGLTHIQSCSCCAQTISVTQPYYVNSATTILKFGPPIFRRLNFGGWYVWTHSEVFEITMQLKQMSLNLNWLNLLFFKSNQFCFSPYLEFYVNFIIPFSFIFCSSFFLIWFFSVSFLFHFYSNSIASVCHNKCSSVEWCANNFDFILSTVFAVIGDENC